MTLRQVTAEGAAAAEVDKGKDPTAPVTGCGRPGQSNHNS